MVDPCRKCLIEVSLEHRVDVVTINIASEMNKYCF